MAVVDCTVAPRASKAKRPLIDNGNGTHSVPLTQGKFAVIDSDMADAVARFNWSLICIHRSEYAATGLWLNGKRIGVLLHHAVLGRPLNGLMIDHKSHDGLDNRLCNLRIVTPRDNQCNLRKKNLAGFTGVHLVPRKNFYFYANIRIRGKSVYLGCRRTAEEAAKLYDAAREIMGFDPQFGNHLPLSLEDYYAAHERLRAFFAPKPVEIAVSDRRPVRIRLSRRIFSTTGLIFA